MMRCALALVLALVATGVPAIAAAQEFQEFSTATDVAPELPRQEIGARLGLQAAIGDETPGGLRVAGVHLYRMTDDLYADTEMAFTFGTAGAACYYDRSDPPMLDCDHGTSSGFSVLAASGVRWVLPFQAAQFQPYVRGSAGLEVLHFSGDEVTGVGIPLQGAAGGRFFAAERLQIGGELLLQLGTSYLSRGLGWEPYSALAVQATVDFSL